MSRRKNVDLVLGVPVSGYLPEDLYSFQVTKFDISDGGKIEIRGVVMGPARIRVTEKDRLRLLELLTRDLWKGASA
jgi:hypothetical protein